MRFGHWFLAVIVYASTALPDSTRHEITYRAVSEGGLQFIVKRTVSGPFEQIGSLAEQEAKSCLANDRNCPLKYARITSFISQELNGQRRVFQGGAIETPDNVYRPPAPVEKPWWLRVWDGIQGQAPPNR